MAESDEGGATDASAPAADDASPKVADDAATATALDAAEDVDEDDGDYEDDGEYEDEDDGEFDEAEEDADADAAVAAAPPVDEVADRDFIAAQELFVNPPAAKGKWQFLLISIALFAGVMVLQGGANTLTDLAILLGVLLFHELGHALAMLVFRYTDVRVFFIPLFGAAASGRRLGVARWKQGVVLMMGPLPGLVIGCVLLLRGVEGTVLTAALQLVAINAFNLLPIAPFDGGQLVQLVLFSRHRRLEIAFLLFAGVALIALALALEAWILALLGVFMLFGLSLRNKILVAAEKLSSAGLPEDSRTLDEPQRRRLFDAVWALMPVQWQGKPQPQASTMEQIHERAVQRPLSAATSAGITGLWIAGLAVTALSVYTVIDNRFPDEVIAPAQWQRYYNTARTFSIELPAQPVESYDPQPTLMATRGSRAYGVTWGPIVTDEQWTAFEGLATGLGTRVRDLSIPTGKSLVLKTEQGEYASVLVIRRDGLGYLIMASAFVDDPENDRVLRSFRFEPAPP